MAFWGTEVKAGKPVTHKFDQVKGRLHISQAALGLGSASNKSVVQCNVGDKSPVILCVLLPDKTESCHLDLQFEESDDVVFSVIGPRSVHLTGYYSSSRHVNHNDSSESYGVDIANSDSVHSVHGSDEDKYDDSFINDDDPEVFSASPISNDIADEEMSDEKKPKERKGSLKRLKKRYKPVVSEDESNSQTSNHNGNSILESHDEDTAMILASLKSKATQVEEKLEKQTCKTDQKKIEYDGSHLQNHDDGTPEKNISDIGDKSEPKKKRKEKRQKTPDDVPILKNDGEDISTLLESKTAQAEEILEKEISKTGEKRLENGRSHLQNQDNSTQEKKISDFGEESGPKKKRKEKGQKTPEGVSVLKNDGEDIPTLLESITTQAEEKLVKEISKTGENKLENGGTHLQNQDNSINEKKISDFDNKPGSKKKRKEKRHKTPEGVSVLENDGEDTSMLLESKTTQSEENLEKETSKTRERKIENGGSHLQNQDNSIHEKKIFDIDDKFESKKKRKEKRQEKTPEGVSVLKDDGESTLVESKTTQAEEKMEKEISKAAEKKRHNDGTHLQTQDNSVHDKTTNDMDNVAICASKSKKKRKERTKETPEAYGESQNIVMKDEKTMPSEEKTEEKSQVFDRKEGQTCDDSLLSTKSNKENDVRPKKRRKKPEGENLVRQATLENVSKQGEVNQNEGGAQDSCKDIAMEDNQKSPHDNNLNLVPNQAVEGDRLKDKKSRKKRDKTLGKEENGVTGVSQLAESDKRNGLGGSNDKNVQSKLSKAKTLSNGLVIEDIDMGKPDGKVATSGKKIKVHYVGKLRDGGHIFDSNIGKSPLKFCLGAEGVTEGWNIGLDGMRVGGKRRLTIPPANGDGSQGAGENVPPNSWLVYDFELVGVR